MRTPVFAILVHPVSPIKLGQVTGTPVYYDSFMKHPVFCIKRHVEMLLETPCIV